MLEGNDMLPDVTLLSVVLLVVSLMMGLKLRWFRARMSMSKSTADLTMAGVYRSRAYETPRSMSHSQTNLTSVGTSRYPPSSAYNTRNEQQISTESVGTSRYPPSSAYNTRNEQQISTESVGTSQYPPSSAYNTRNEQQKPSTTSIDSPPSFATMGQQNKAVPRSNGDVPTLHTSLSKNSLFSDESSIYSIEQETRPSNGTGRRPQTKSRAPPPPKGILRGKAPPVPINTPPPQRSRLDVLQMDESESES